jgi:hypothetical protein
VVLVGDRGMITSARIEEDLQPVGLDWIAALRAPAIRKLAEDGGPRQISLFDGRDMAELTSPDVPARIRVQQPRSCRQAPAQAQRAVAATENDLVRVQAAVPRQRKSLHGEDAIGLKVGATLGKRKMAKHFHLAITDTSFDFTRIEDAVADEALLTGFYVLPTNVPAESLAAAKVEGPPGALASLDIGLLVAGDRLGQAYPAAGLRSCRGCSWRRGNLCRSSDHCAGSAVRQRLQRQCDLSANGSFFAESTVLGLLKTPKWANACADLGRSVSQTPTSGVIKESRGSEGFLE